MPEDERGRDTNQNSQHTDDETTTSDDGQGQHEETSRSDDIRSVEQAKLGELLDWAFDEAAQDPSSPEYPASPAEDESDDDILQGGS